MDSESVTNTINPATPPVSLDKSRGQFLESLESRRHDIQSLWIAYQSDPSLARLQAFHMAAHRMKCRSGALGYLDIHAAASWVEELLIESRADRRLLSSGEGERVTMAMDRLCHAEPTVVRPQVLSLPVAMLPSRHRGTLYLLEGDASQAGQIMAQLAAHGYSLVHLHWLTALHDLGFQIMMDRFDGSEAGFQCLEQLPVNVVRLAPNLILRLREQQTASRNVATIVDQLHSAGTKVLVGFVEDAQILSILFQQQVDMVQGFFLAMPDIDMDYEFQIKVG